MVFALSQIKNTMKILGVFFKELQILPYDKKILLETKYKFIPSYVYNSYSSSFENTWYLFRKWPLNTLSTIWNDLNEYKFLC